MSGQDFAQRVVDSQEFREYILVGVKSSTLPQAVMCRLLDHAWGQPVKRLEIDDKTKALMALDKRAVLERLETLRDFVQELPEEPSSSIH